MIVKGLINRSLRVSVLASAILVGFTLVTTNAGEKRPVIVEDIPSMKTVSDPQMSPDGTRIAKVKTPPLVQVGESERRVPKTQSLSITRLSRTSEPLPSW